MFRQKLHHNRPTHHWQCHGRHEATLKQEKESFVKMQVVTTQFDEKFAGTVQELEKMRLAGVKFKQNA